MVIYLKEGVLDKKKNNLHLHSITSISNEVSSLLERFQL